MNIAVLFDGAGLARLGLEQAGHTCTGYELDPWKHHLSKSVGSGNVHLADVRDVSLSGFDAVWASPPCQFHSVARTTGDPISDYAVDLLHWSLQLDAEVLWVENVVSAMSRALSLPIWNAAQFMEQPVQNRNRVVAGRHAKPQVHRPYTYAYPGICPCVTATEYKGCATDQRRASRFYGRRITVDEAAHHQGFTVPAEWREPPPGWDRSPTQWRNNLYEAIGNGVPVYMARAFGAAHAGE